MKRYIALLWTACILATVSEVAYGANVSINAENFPDETFRAYVSNKFDKDNGQ